MDVPGHEVTLWDALIGPKGMSREMVDRINFEVTRMKLKAAATTLQGDGVTSAARTPKVLKAQITRDLDLYHQITQSAGIKPE